MWSPGIQGFIETNGSYFYMIIFVLEIMEPFLPPDPECLEMFARSLTPKWSSWGNETIKYQNLSYYRKSESPLRQLLRNRGGF